MFEPHTDQLSFQPGASGALTLVPTARLARIAAARHATAQIESGLQTWASPRILRFSAWISELCEEYFATAADLRLPIGSGQALTLWQALVDNQVFAGEVKVAQLAQRAWRTLHEFELDPPERWPDSMLTIDNQHFKDWALAYRRRCQAAGLIDEWSFAAELPALFETGQLTAPKRIELHGFDLPPTPLQRGILDACASVGSDVVECRDETGGRAIERLLEFPLAEDELRGAAQWARQQLRRQPQLRLGIVMPDLNRRLAQTERIMRQIFDPPAAALEPGGPPCWHISLGHPLTQWPLVADALHLLALRTERISAPQTTRLLRSPFIAGWVPALGARDLTLATLARLAPYRLTINELCRALSENKAGAGSGTEPAADRQQLAQAGCADDALAERLRAWQRLRRRQPAAAWPSEWAAQFQNELTTFGFGHGRSLNSVEYQVLARWHELLEDFGAQDLVVAAPLGREVAVSMLSARAGALVFREQDPGVPVEVLGIDEALGSRFDALWVTTLDRETWPGATRRDPLLPTLLQRSLPRGTSEGCLAQARAQLAGLLACAPIVVGSFVRGDDEIAVAPTTLLGGLAVDLQAPADLPTPAAMAPACNDDQAPPVPGTSARGGTGLLRDQSGCPFRAFAARRLGAVEQRGPRPGLDASQRGDIMHRALETFWRQVDGHLQLMSLSASEQSRQIELAVTTALDNVGKRYRLTLSRRARGLEQRRLERTLERWLAIERERSPFEIVDLEAKVEIELAGLRLSGKIDRRDRLEDGSTLLIDYKTNSVGRSKWFPDARMGEPQLPAYAVAIEPAPSAIAFAQLRPELLQFEGLAANDIGVAGTAVLATLKYKFKDLNSWSELLTHWRSALEGLARDFAVGNARVDPRDATVCKTCHLHALCRIHERDPFAALDDPGEAQPDSDG